MSSVPIWITGSTRSGKTTRLIAEFQDWVAKKRPQTPHLVPNSLVLAANNENRRILADHLSVAVAGTYPALVKTPLGFFTEEVTLFWPLLFEALDLRAQFPLRLRPETEQELATKLWGDILTQPEWEETGVSEYKLVRLILDLLQLAGASGTPLEAIPLILEQGLSAQLWAANPILTRQIGEMLQQWQKWCLDRGLLTYGIIYDLYWRYLLPNGVYQKQLSRRYAAIFADDVDDYPAIAKDLFITLLDDNSTGLFTYNPHGQIRLGLNADPEYLATLANRCQVEILTPDPNSSVGTQWGETLIQALEDPFSIPTLPDNFQSLHETNRAGLLRKTANFIIDSIKKEIVEPRDIAIIAPGLDEIARYTLMEILTKAEISVNPLNEQRPLIGSALVRGLLTLLALVYPGLGKLLSQDGIAEMLEVLAGQDEIDPVRAGLLADYCYKPDYNHPHLLPVTAFPRWDRLGNRTVKAYEQILAWVEAQQKNCLHNLNLEQPLVITTSIHNSAINLLDKAINDFFDNGSFLPYPQLSALRELIETAQHYWEVNKRQQRNEPQLETLTETLRNFIELLRKGTITANAYPLQMLNPNSLNAVTLATIYQYRSLRSVHPWQFWLDTSSHLWSSGGAAMLFAAPLFLKSWSRQPLTPEEEGKLEKERLNRILHDLSGRATERIYFCHSDLAVNGTEQTGELLTLVHSTVNNKATIGTKEY